VALKATFNLAENGVQDDNPTLSPTSEENLKKDWRCLTLILKSPTVWSPFFCSCQNYSFNHGKLQLQPLIFRLYFRIFQQLFPVSCEIKIFSLHNIYKLFSF